MINMRVAKLLSKVLMAILIIALALYGFYYYQVKSTIDRHIQQMQPFVNVEYDALTVNPFGLISLNNVDVSLMGQPGIVIDRVGLTSDPLFYMQFESKVNRGEWPESLALAVEGLNVDFGMPLFLMLEQFADKDSAEVQLSALGCGNVKQFDMSALRMMGMRQGRFDLFVALKNPRQGPLNMQLLMTMQGWSELSVDIDMATGSSLDQLVSVAPNLQRVSFSFRDIGFNQRRNQFCAMQSGLSVAEYQALHQSLLSDWIEQAQLNVPQTLLDAYFQLAEPNASAAVQLSLAGLQPEMYFSPDQLLRVLMDRLILSVNNQIVSVDPESLLLMFELLQQPALASLPAEVEELVIDPNAPRVMPGVASPPVVAAPTVAHRRYQHTPHDELGNYVGHPVRFFTAFGKRVDGVLVSVEGTALRVAERVQHGVAQYPVELNTIQGVEVYR